MIDFYLGVARWGPGRRLIIGLLLGLWWLVSGTIWEILSYELLGR